MWFDLSLVENVLLGPPSGPSGRALEYLEAIDRRAGKAKRMDFLRIGGSEAAVDRWVTFLVRERLLVELLDQDGSRVYTKTAYGERAHKILQDHRIVKMIVEHLSGQRLRP